MIVRLVNSERQRDQFVLTQLPALVGRGLDTTVTLQDRWASRHHCRIERDASQVVVRDLGSTHGTFVNGKLITESPLSSGDRLSIGLITFRVEVVHDEVAARDEQYEGVTAA